jgi:hypothetical protein
MTDHDAVVFRTFIRKYGVEGVTQELIHITRSYAEMGHAVQSPKWSRVRTLLVMAYSSMGQKIRPTRKRRGLAATPLKGV